MLRSTEENSKYSLRTAVPITVPITLPIRVPKTVPMTDATKWALSIATILLAVVVQQFATFPINNAFTSSLNNWMHVPMFAFIMGVLLNLFPRIKIGYLVVGVVVVALSSEALQFFTSREPSWQDLARDALGAGLALGFFRPSASRRLIGVVCVCIATLALPSVYLVGNVYQHATFPVLFDPAKLFSRILCHSGSNPSYTNDHNWQRYLNKPVLALNWNESTWPRVYVTETISDWNDYNEIVIDAYNPESVAQPLTIAVHYLDLLGKDNPSRYQELLLLPGDNRLRASITVLAGANEAGSLQIRHLMLNTTKEHAGKRLLLGRIWLE